MYGKCAGASHTHFTGYRRCTKTVSTSPTRGNYVRNLWAATVEEDCRLTNEFQRRLSSPYVAWEAWVVTVIFEMSGQFGKIPLAEEKRRRDPDDVFTHAKECKARTTQRPKK